MPCERSTKRGFARRYWLTVAVLLIAGIGGSHFVVPTLIRRAYAEQSIGLFNALISGRDRIPLAQYLESWSRVWPRIGAAFLVAAVGLYLLLHFRPAIRTWFRNLPRTRPIHVVLLAVTLGTVVGLAEGLYKGGSMLLFPTPYGFTTLHVFWMAPVTGAVAFGALGLLAWPGARRWPRLFSMPVLLLLWGTAALYGLVRALKLGIHPWAALICALGASVALAQWAAAADPPTVVRRLKQLLSGVVPVTTLIAFVMLVSDPIRSARLMARLPAVRAGPNILLIILDTVRAHDLSIYGYERATTPNLERFGREGVVFDRAVAPSSWTLPSHASMFTGHFNLQLGTSWAVPLNGTYPTLAERLRDRGYETVAYVANLNYTTTASGLLRGFVRYEDRPFTPSTILSHHWLIRHVVGTVRAALGNHRRVMRVPAERLRDRFLDWHQDRDPARPFFAFMNLFDAHEPYELPRGGIRRFATQDARYWVGTKFGSIRQKEQILSDLRDSYDDAIAYLDTQLGALFAELDQRGVLDSTIVLVTSDHGEQFGERRAHLVEHGNTLYFSSIHVPLLIRYPASVPAGMRVKEWVSLRDLAATILDIAGAPAELPGTSLVTSWNGAATTRRTPPFSDLVPAPVFKMRPAQSLLEGNLHYLLRADGAEELYDIVNDPWERHNLATIPGAQTKLTELRASLERVIVNIPRDAHVNAIGAMRAR